MEIITVWESAKLNEARGSIGLCLCRVSCSHKLVVRPNSHICSHFAEHFNKGRIVTKVVYCYDNKI